MVTIVRRGPEQEDGTYQADCNHCRSTLQFKRSEVTSTSSHRNEDYWHFACPACGKNVSVDATLARKQDEETKDNHG
jgi:predicted RNA-binding Zn-ribbon protein involved in translation (DUF1610 family)